MFREPLTRAEKMAHEYNFSNDAPSVYCGTYEKYNNGSIYGMWIDLTSFDTYQEFHSFCQRLHADEEDPELMFQDFDCFPEAWYSESFFSEETFKRIKAYASLEEDIKTPYCIYLERFNKQASIEVFEQHFHGRYTSGAEFAEELYRSCYQIPGYLEGCIDWESVWFQLDNSGDYTFIEGYIFSRY